MPITSKGIPARRITQGRIGSPGRIALPAPTPPYMRVRVRRSENAAASALIAPALSQLRLSAHPHAAMLSALWTLDGGIPNWRAMARRPRPCALSLPTSAGCLQLQTNRYLVMVGVRPAPNMAILGPTPEPQLSTVLS
jgi:hypothetical protein